MDPTAEQIPNFATIDDIVTWTELPGAIDEPNSPKARLYALLGTDGTQHPRAIGAMLATDFDALIAGWTYGDPASPPSPVCRVQAGLVGRVARIICGIDKTQDQERADKAASDAAAAALALATTSVGVTTPASGKKIKMATIINQANDDEIEPMPETRLKASFDHYKQVTGGFPPSQKECTIEQLSGLLALVDAKAAPYCDFNIWGPHQYRIMKKLKLQGMVLMPGGEMKHIEISGPSTFPLWEGCYDVLETGLVQLDVVRLARTTGYHDLFRHYINRYGDRVWHIMYQADVRMRQEEMPRICRRGQSEYDDALAAGGIHPFNPSQPWDWVWDQANNASSFWRRELEEPCLLVTSKAAPLQSMLDGDANIQLDRGNQQRLKRNFEGQQNTRSIMVQAERMHQVKDGIYECNRRGTPLCPGWQDGTCTSTIAGARCGRDWSQAHQCSRCLSADHGKDQCNSKGDPKAPFSPSRKGAWGGTKGGGKGKKGKGKK